MKSILLSIKPKYVELIARGEKTIEVRKTRPKIETPFKCYIYCTYGNMKENYCLGMRGKVIGEFVCDDIGTTSWISTPEKLDWKDGYNEETCLTNRETYEYSKGGLFYEWHISDLKIYDKPKELSEFYRECKKPCKPNKGKILCITTKSLKMNGCNGKIPLTRPPQSWCKVEELQEEKK